jgi:hypothetical protein
MVNSEQNDEECDATGDDSSNDAGNKKGIIQIIYIKVIRGICWIQKFPLES